MREPLTMQCHKKALIVICNDGSTFRMAKGKWEMLPALPGTKAHEEALANARKPRVKRVRAGGTVVST